MRYREKYPHRMEQMVKLRQQYVHEVSGIYSRLLDLDSERNAALREQCESASIANVEAPRANLDDLIDRLVEDGTLVEQRMLDAKQRLKHAAMAMETLLGNRSSGGDGKQRKTPSTSTQQVSTEQEHAVDTTTDTAEPPDGDHSLERGKGKSRTSRKRKSLAASRLRAKQTKR